MAPLPPLDDLAALGLAWARVFPTITIVPAFGLRALPAPARGVLGLALAASIFPALAPVVIAQRATPWFLLALEQIVLGLPVALAAAIPLWAATMAGGLIDVLRGSPDGQGLATVEGRPSSFGVLLSLFASVVFLATGGASRAAGFQSQSSGDLSVRFLSELLSADREDCVRDRNDICCSWQ